MDKRERELRKFAKRNGLEVVHSTRHFLLIARDGTVVATSSVSSSDRRALKNLEAEVRRWRESQ